MFTTCTKAMAAALTLASATAATAGGYVPPVVETAIAPVVETAPVGEWAGAYGGATLGYAFGGDDKVGIQTSTGFSEPDSVDLDGVNVGLRAGYRWQKDRWVFGPELAIEGGDVSADFDKDGYSGKSKVKYALGLRMKTGYVLDNDLLVYGIAGAIHAKVDYKVEGTGAVGDANIDDDFSRTGYVVGLGVEKMLNERMSLTGEYEYANFGKKTLTSSDASTRATPDYHNVKVGLNFKF